jgi:2-(1,2-epoxy-1,2-dihydrophenyl)acetyl-CoA isomerase
VLPIERDGPVVTATLKRPESLNALNAELTAALSNFFEALYRDRSVRVVVLQGAVRAFLGKRPAQFENR